MFIAIRRGHNRNPGPVWETLVTSPWGSAEMGRELVADRVAMVGS